MTFTPEVYEQIREGARRSAAVIVPLVFDLFAPKLVVDVGCGEGIFAEAFAKHGCVVAALDESVDGIRVCLDAEWGTDDEPGVVTYRHVDLERDYCWATELSRHYADGKDHRPEVGESGFAFDLAVCLEVAEHLDPDYSEDLVSSLCHLAPVVLFSAAVPGQGGHGHRNEQWPEFWAQRFRDEGRLVSGGLRWHLWDSNVEPWYAQNLLVAATRVASCDTDDLHDPELLRREPLWGFGLFDDDPPNAPISVVHPTIWEHRRQRP